MANAPGLESGIRCPFFRDTKSMSIVCEAPIAGATSVTITFPSISRRASHILWRCNEPDGGGCPVYQAIMRKYTEKEDRPHG